MFNVSEIISTAEIILFQFQTWLRVKQKKSKLFQNNFDFTYNHGITHSFFSAVSAIRTDIFLSFEDLKFVALMLTSVKLVGLLVVGWVCNHHCSHSLHHLDHRIIIL